jgi:predicted nucleotidyltransferase
LGKYTVRCGVTQQLSLSGREDTMDKAILLADIKKAITEKIGNDRLKGLFLFGSEARSTATDNSDIDILVLLEGPVRLASDLQEVISSTYPIQLELDRFLHFIVADSKDYDSGEYSLYRSIKGEGVAA